MEVEIKVVETTEELADTFALCNRALENINPIYSYDIWVSRFTDGTQLSVFAKDESRIVSAVMGRVENEKSLIAGLVACDENYRNRGITKAVLERFEEESYKRGFKYITLGSYADWFYEKCGYKCIGKSGEQSIYQKLIG